MFELSELTGKVVLKSRMYVKLSYDLKKSYSLCKGPGAQASQHVEEWLQQEGQR